MTEGDGKKAGTLDKIKLGLLLGAGAILLWFLIVNLFTDSSLSLWPLTTWAGIKMPATLFLFIFLALGFAGGFGTCFYWLRGQRLGKAVDLLTEKDVGTDGAEEPGEGGEPS